MSPEMFDVFTSLGAAGGATAVLSMILLRQINSTAAERTEWLHTIRAESAETRATVAELRDAVVDLRVAIAERDRN
jgi:hypothetical protein